MAINFEPAQPLDLATSRSYGSLQQQMALAPLQLQAQQQAFNQQRAQAEFQAQAQQQAFNRQREQAQFQQNAYQFEAQRQPSTRDEWLNQQNQQERQQQQQFQTDYQRQAFDLQGELHKTQLSQAEELRLNRVKQQLEIVRSRGPVEAGGSGQFSAEDVANMETQLQTTINPLDQRLQRSQLLTQQLAQQTIQRQTAQEAIQARTYQDFMNGPTFNPQTGRMTQTNPQTGEEAHYIQNGRGGWERIEWSQPGGGRSRGQGGQQGGESAVTPQNQLQIINQASRQVDAEIRAERTAGDPAVTSEARLERIRARQAEIIGLLPQPPQQPQPPREQPPFDPNRLGTATPEQQQVIENLQALEQRVMPNVPQAQQEALRGHFNTVRTMLARYGSRERMPGYFIGESGRSYEPAFDRAMESIIRTAEGSVQQQESPADTRPRLTAEERETEIQRYIRGGSRTMLRALGLTRAMTREEAESAVDERFQR